MLYANFLRLCLINPFIPTGAFANSADPDEMEKSISETQGWKGSGVQ